MFFTVGRVKQASLGYDLSYYEVDYYMRYFGGVSHFGGVSYFGTHCLQRKFGYPAQICSSILWKSRAGSHSVHEEWMLGKN